MYLFEFFYIFTTFFISFLVPILYMDVNVRGTNNLLEIFSFIFEFVNAIKPCNVRIYVCIHRYLKGLFQPQTRLTLGMYIEYEKNMFGNRSSSFFANPSQSILTSICFLDFLFF